MKILTNRKIKLCLQHIINICNALTICCLSVTDKEDRQKVLNAIDDLALLTSTIGGLNGLIFVCDEIDKEGEQIKADMKGGSE